MKLLFFSRMTLAFVGFFGLPQQPTDTFEVVAIHPSRADSMNTQIQMQPGGRLIIVNATLRTLIRNAYGVLPFQIIGEPKWSEIDHFDINAKNSSGQEMTQESARPLMQNLLADRFHLKAHWETREEAVFALVVEKDGPKFQPHADSLQHGMNSSRQPGKVNMRGADVTMTQLADELAFRLQRFVIDQTGLAGHYDFILHWNPDPVIDGASANESEPSLGTALHEQLGLKLNPTKGPVKVLVIDAAEKPTEN
jgi:uncharacterized protein (TIGR03435 family)